MIEQINSKCYFCGLLEKPRDIGIHTDKGMDYVLHECPNCRAQFWTPFKNPGAQWYENDERYKNANIDPSEEPTWSHRKIISLLAPFKGRVFDIGCGTGNFLRWAKLNGWDVAGIDFDSNAINSARINFSLPNIELSALGDYVEKHKNEHLRYDLITFFDVFEHIDDHRDFLELIKSILSSNGYLAMSMPYRSGARWLQSNDLPPRHLTRWDEASLKNFLGREGFNVEYVKHIPASLYYIVMKLRSRYGSAFSFGLVNKVREKQSAISDTGKNGLTGRQAEAGKNFMLRAIRFLAKIKDIVIFGIPALMIWLAMFFSQKRYTGLFVIARKTAVAGSKVL